MGLIITKRCRLCGHRHGRLTRRCLQPGCRCDQPMTKEGCGDAAAGYEEDEVDSQEKKAFASEAEKALDHPLVCEVMEEFADNMGLELDGLPRYGLVKVAHYAASVARAQALGIDPDDLRHTPEEAGEAMAAKMRAAREAGVPTSVVVTDELDGRAS